MEVQTIPLPPATDFNFDSNATSPYATAPSSPQSTMIPFFWEHKPRIPKQNNHDTDFAFGRLERHSISAADDLFDCGKIKPLKPPPCMHFANDSPGSSKPPSFRFKEVLSGFDPFSEALKLTPNPPEVENETKNNRSTRWNIKNLLLFRRASEGSVTTRKDSLNKYTMLKKDETFSFRNTGGSMMVSVEEVNFTVAGETRRKTNLPCKSGLLGCLRFHQNAGSVMKQ